VLPDCVSNGVAEGSGAAGDAVDGAVDAATSTNFQSTLVETHISGLTTVAA
jgi:hypothetical protein